jgi:hypothetical protein
LKALRRILAVLGNPSGAGPWPADDAATDSADGSPPTFGMTATSFLDTIHLPQGAGEPEDERIVRPSLAILFRMAVGPGADYYAPRFLEYERTGQSFPSWNWGPVCAPAVWAVYRRLWSPAIAFAVWPLLGLAVYRIVEPHLDPGAGSIAVAAVLAWLAPRAVAAMIANPLVYRRARRLVGAA